jgi:hypothetical protein
MNKKQKQVLQTLEQLLTLMVSVFLFYGMFIGAYYSFNLINTGATNNIFPANETAILFLSCIYMMIITGYSTVCNSSKIGVKDES